MYKFIWRKVNQGIEAVKDKNYEEKWELQGDIIFRSNELKNTWMDQTDRYSMPFAGSKKKVTVDPSSDPNQVDLPYTYYKTFHHDHN